MAVSVENTSTLGRRLTMRVSDEAVKAQCKSRMAKLAQEMHSQGTQFRGFRPGKMPSSELQKRFGQSVRKEAIQTLVDEVFNEAMKENGWQPIDAPKIEAVKEEPHQGIEFTAVFEIYPTVTLADLSGVVIEKRVADITDNDVKNMIVKLCDQLAEWEGVDRAVQKEDKLKVDFTRLLKHEGAKQEEQKDVQLIVGDKGVVPGLSEALLGKKQGDHVEIEMRYPTDWADSKVADQAALLGITILEITQKKVLTQEALKEKLEVENLHTEVEKRMQQELEAVLRDEVKETVLEKLLEKNVVDLPPSLIEREKEAIHKERERRGGAEKPEALEEEAKRRVELGLLLNEVIKKYEVKIDEKIVRQEVEKIAASFPNASQVVQAYYRNHQLLHGIERKVLLEEAVDALLKELTVNEKQVGFDEIMNPPDTQEESREV